MKRRNNKEKTTAKAYKLPEIFYPKYDLVDWILAAITDFSLLAVLLAAVYSDWEYKAVKICFELICFGITAFINADIIYAVQGKQYVKIDDKCIEIKTLFRRINIPWEKLLFAKPHMNSYGKIIRVKLVAADRGEGLRRLASYKIGISAFKYSSIDFDRLLLTVGLKTKVIVGSFSRRKQYSRNTSFHY